MRGSPTGELVFDNCEVPAQNLLGERDGGVRVLMSGLDYERAVLAAGPLGIMQACMDVVTPYIHERRQFGTRDRRIPADPGQDRRHVYQPVVVPGLRLRGRASTWTASAATRAACARIAPASSC